VNNGTNCSSSLRSLTLATQCTSSKARGPIRHAKWSLQRTAYKQVDKRTPTDAELPLENANHYVTNGRRRDVYNEKQLSKV